MQQQISHHTYNHVYNKNYDVYRKLLPAAQTNELLKKLINSGKPFMVARSGLTETTCLFQYIHNRHTYKKSNYSGKCVRLIINNSGFFIKEPWYYGIARLHKKTYALLSHWYSEHLDIFCYIYMEAMRDADVMAALFGPGEAESIKRACPEDVKMVNLYNLEPFRYEEPWSMALEGKKVLVIHPFTETIESQYCNHRQNIFADPNVLPKFELKTIKAVQSLSLSRHDCGFDSWFDALDHMKEQVTNSDFDIAIIGCGAYGLPLASHVKHMGKQAIHMGGGTQLLFGIKGKRWEESGKYQKFFSHGHWVKPGESENIKSHRHMIEPDCYW